MRTLLKGLVALIGVAVAARVAATVVSKRAEEGSAVSDEFRRLAVLDGIEFSSRAGGLRSAQVGVVLGGARIDLRDATIDPGGATVLLENTLGGLVLMVRDEWAVTVDDTILGGGETQISVTPPMDVPDDAPQVHVQVITRLCGTVMTTDPGARPGALTARRRNPGPWSSPASSRCRITTGMPSSCRQPMPTKPPGPGIIAGPNWNSAHP